MLSEKLSKLRKEKGLSQAELAETLNVSRQAVSRWETGAAMPSLENLKCLRDLYDVSLDYLVSDGEEPKTHPSPESEGGPAADTAVDGRVPSKSLPREVESDRMASYDPPMKGDPYEIGQSGAQPAPMEPGLGAKGGAGWSRRTIRPRGGKEYFMSKAKKIVLIAGSAVVALVILAGLACWYRVYHPRIYIAHGIGTHEDEGFHSERVEVAVGEREGIPMAKSIREELKELSDWNNAIDAELLSYRINGPCDIRVSGKTQGGEITLRYEGYVTSENGERVDYHKEMTFDLPVRQKDFTIPAL